MSLTKHSQRNLSVIENFILYLTHCSDDKEPNFTLPQTYTPEELYRVAYDYIMEDHVDGEKSEEALAEKEEQLKINEVLEAVDLVMGHPLALEVYQSKFGLLGEEAKIFIRANMIKVGAKNLLLKLAKTIREENEILNK